jgi:CheY-like chemotaxis protein
MPEVTGHQVLAERAAEPELRKIPVIIITASRGDETARVLNEGIYALLPKPFDIETLNALVKSCLGQV